ncbi:MAG: adenylate/guanylate cyclase domain-containing protein [Phycisphaeraceae bacterium]|nr:adenylate/guanylate cyclase domain-containing protein [Phycisphaeraceae bacterium]
MAQDGQLFETYRALERQFENDHKEVVVFFADLSASTSFKYKHGPIKGAIKPFEHNRIIRTCIEAETDYSHPGTVVKLLGDGVMGYFEGPDAAEHAIMSGLNAIMQLDMYNASIPDSEWDFRIQTRIGIHAGKVWMLKLRDNETEDPQGSTVDYAARLCGLALPMHIVISESTWDCANRLERQSTVPFECDCKGPYDRLLRGIPGVQRLYGVTKPSPENNRPHAEPVPLPGSYRPPTPEIVQQLKTASDLLEVHHDLPGAISSYTSLRGKDQRIFEANLRLAELKLKQVQRLPNHVVRSEENEWYRLWQSAYECLCDAKSERPTSCYVWIHLARLYHEKSEHIRKARPQNLEELKICLAKAVQYAKHALEIANGNMDEWNMAVAKILLIEYISLQKKEGTADSDDVELPERYIEQVRYVVGRGLGQLLASEFKTGQAMNCIANREQQRDLYVEAISLNHDNNLAIRLLLES